LKPLASLVLATFILLQREDLRNRLIRLFGSRDLHRTTITMDEAARGLSHYFLAQLSVNVGVGMGVAAGLALIGVPGALLFGVVAALLRFVPYFGIWISAALAVIMASAADPGWSMMLWTLALFGGIELIAAQLVEPFLYGHGTGLSPFAVIVAAIFWSWIWGPVGLVLSTPLTLCLVILGRRVQALEFFDVLFGDRPALTAAQTFYQRLLANDPDEAFAQAEALLRDCSLCAYYDTVVMEGLRHARRDLLRGVLTPEQLRRIKKSALDLFARLEQSGEPKLAPSVADPSHRLTVLCIGGRGKLDSLAVAVTRQLLAKSGFAAEHSSYERFSRHDPVDVSRTTIFCVVSFDAAENPPYLRHLLRRLMQVKSGAHLIVGMAASSSELGYEGVAATTLGELIAACASAAGEGSSNDSAGTQGLAPR
jgi:hypothetical protein